MWLKGEGGWKRYNGMLPLDVESQVGAVFIGKGWEIPCNCSSILPSVNY